jgi:methionyl-tRNA formyltransferase
MILFIGTPEADATAFERLARANFPAIALLATNDRAVAKKIAPAAEVIIGHHFQFDDHLLQSAPDVTTPPKVAILASMPWRFFRV